MNFYQYLDAALAGLEHRTGQPVTHRDVFAFQADLDGTLTAHYYHRNPDGNAVYDRPTNLIITFKAYWNADQHFEAPSDDS